ncbi:MAG TPA: DUF2332 domain-containing protein [Mycobacteriales bacterium]|nr:DUF2332 domain-containing protein [Mycobacteriales bacterium]
MSSSPVVRRLTDQAEQCERLGSPLYAEILLRAAADVTAGGPTAALLDGHQDDPPGSALPLRLMAALHRQVLTRNAPQLALHYPSVGGQAGLPGAWAAARLTLQLRAAQLAEDLNLPCQTNEPGRSAGLLVGLLHAAREHPGRPLRLLEFGASAGLNLQVDRFRIGEFGPPDAPVLLAEPWAGPAPELVGYRLADRAGCDLAPIDPAAAGGRLALSASVWADQVERFARLRTALAIAAAHPVPVARASACAWLAGHLAHPTAGQATVVWHSVVWQYLEPAEQSAINELMHRAGRRATASAPLIHLSFEPELRGRREVVFALRATSWPGGRRVHLADGQGHGPPVRLRS